MKQQSIKNRGFLGGTWLKLPLLLIAIYSLSGCAGPYVFSTSSHQDHDLYSEKLQSEGIAFLTPSTITGQEQDKQALAFIFSEVLAKTRPDIRRVTLPETLSAVNRADMVDEYMLMYQQYQQTGIFKHASLKRLGELTNARYVAQLKLAGFEQDSSGRFGVLGLRVLETKSANIRLFLQIWDTKMGTIAWEAEHEMNVAEDVFTEKKITFREVVTKSAEEIFTKLPENTIAKDKKDGAEKDHLANAALK